MDKGRFFNNIDNSGARSFKSIYRAIRRGHITETGFVIPKRPFNNRKRTAGRELEIQKESIYDQLKNN